MNNKIYTSGCYDSNVRDKHRQLQAMLSKMINVGYSVYPSTLLFEAMQDANSIYMVPIMDQHGKIGFADLLGMIIVAPKYDDFKGFFYSKDNVVSVKLDNRWNVINNEGKELFESFISTTILPSVDSHMVSIGNRICNPDDKSSFKTFSNVTYVSAFRYGYARIHFEDDTWAMINEQGEIVSKRYNMMYQWYDYPCATTKIKETKDSAIELKTLDELVIVK